MNRQSQLKSHQTAEHRVIALLDREQVDYLDRVGKDALFSTGSKLSRTKIIAATVDLLKDLHISGEGVKTSKQLEERIFETMRHEAVNKTVPEMK